MVSQERSGATGVLERPKEINLDHLGFDLYPEGLEDTSRNGGSYLTVIENPTVNGYLGILMSFELIGNGNGQVFFDNYLIKAKGNNIEVKYHVDFARTEQQDEEPHLYTLITKKTFNTNSEVIYDVGSEIEPLKCDFPAEDYAKFRENLRLGRLEGIVSSMSFILGNRVPDFRFYGGKLFLPENYASTLLPQ